LPDEVAILTELRRQRARLVQTPEQFEFVFKASLARLKASDWAYYAQ
jgi:protein tyrosine phosphatase